MKHLFQSKTYWVNLLILLVAFLPKDIQPAFMTPEAQAAFAAFVNICLRLITKDEVTLKVKRDGSEP